MVSVKDPVETQSGTWGGDDAVGTFFGGEDLAYFFGAEASASDGIKGSGKTANHAVEVAAALGG